MCALLWLVFDTTGQTGQNICLGTTPWFTAGVFCARLLGMDGCARARRAIVTALAL